MPPCRFSQVLRLTGGNLLGRAVPQEIDSLGYGLILIAIALFFKEGVIGGLKRLVSGRRSAAGRRTPPGISGWSLVDLVNGPKSATTSPS